MATVFENLPNPSFDLACVGTSIRGLGAFTLESYLCLKVADVVYYYPPSSDHLRMMKNINLNLIDLNETIYVPGRDFENAYDAILQEVMGAVRRGKKVAYAVQGSPAFHCGTAVRLHRMALQDGYKSILVSGISSFELLSAELCHIADITNLQIYSAAKFVRGGISVEKRAPCLLFDLGRYAMPAVRAGSDKFVASRLDVLGDRLRETYPSGHKLSLMYITAEGQCRSLHTVVEEVAHAISKVGAGVTIFVPAVDSQESS